MRSAQRRAKNEKVSGNKRKLKILITLIFPVVVILAFFLFFKFTTKYWDGKNKISMVYRNPSGDVSVIILDPILSEKTTLIIPGDTEVNVSHGYGTFRLKNVWQMGINEKLGGGLLTQTITRNFLFPSYLWSEQNLNNIWQFIFVPKSTNIPFGDRVAIVLFALRVKSIDNTEIDLAKNQFLKKQKLTDGELGYIMVGPVSGRLTVYFSDNSFAGKNIKFGLSDATSVPGLSNSVGTILEVLGGKVVTIDKKPIDENLDCLVFGKNKDAVTSVARLFGCLKTSDKSDLDLVLRIGAKFAKRF